MCIRDSLTPGCYVNRRQIAIWLLPWFVFVHVQRGREEGREREIERERDR